MLHKHHESVRPEPAPAAPKPGVVLTAAQAEAEEAARSIDRADKIQKRMRDVIARSKSRERLLPADESKQPEVPEVTKGEFTFYTDAEGRQRLAPMEAGVYPKGERKRAQLRAKHVLPLEALAQKPAGGAGGSRWAQRLQRLFLRADFKPDWLKDLRNTVKGGRSYSALNKTIPESITKELVGIMQDAQKDFRQVTKSAFNVPYTEPERGARGPRYMEKASFSGRKSWVALNNWFLPLLVEHGLVDKNYIEFLRGRKIPVPTQAAVSAAVREKSRAQGKRPRTGGAVRVSRQKDSGLSPLMIGEAEQGLFQSDMFGRPGIAGPMQTSQSAYLSGANPLQHMNEMNVETGQNRFAHLLHWGIRRTLDSVASDYHRNWVVPKTNHPYQVQMLDGAQANFPEGILKRGVDKEALGNQLAWIAAQDMYTYNSEREAKGFFVPTGVAGPKWDGVYHKKMYDKWQSQGRAAFSHFFRQNQRQLLHMRPYLYDHLSQWMVGKKKAMRPQFGEPEVPVGRDEAGHAVKGYKYYEDNGIKNPLQYMYATNNFLDKTYKTRVEEDEKGHFGEHGTYMNDYEKGLMLRDFQWSEMWDLLDNYKKLDDPSQSKHRRRRTEMQSERPALSQRIHRPRKKKKKRRPPPAEEVLDLTGDTDTFEDLTRPVLVLDPKDAAAPRPPSRSATRSPSPPAPPMPPVQFPAPAQRQFEDQLDLGDEAVDAARPAYELAARNLDEIAVRADNLAPGYYGIGRQHYHLMHDLTGAQPVMGRAHIVRAGPTATSKHWLHDVQGDINEGATALMVKARRGPFKDQHGASQVLDRSAHVMYRRRHRTMEVTVKRGVSASEMDLLLSKIMSQQVSAPGCLVVMVKGNKRYTMGTIGKLRMKTLRALIHECLDQYATCGLHLIEGGRVGSMAKKLVNSTAFKVDMQRHRGLFAL